MSFKKRCGDFEIEVSDPWPWWIMVRRAGSGEPIQELRGIRNADELADLKYVVDRAFIHVEQAEAEDRRKKQS